MRISKAVDLALLRQQLISAGQPDPGPLGTSGVAGDGQYEVIGYSNGAAVSLPSAADSVITAHDASQSPYAVQAAADSTAITGLIQQYTALKTGLTAIRTDMTAIHNGPATPTSAQTGTALKLLADDVTTLCNGCDRFLDTIAALVRHLGLP